MLLICKRFARDSLKKFGSTEGECGPWVAFLAIITTCATTPSSVWFCQQWNNSANMSHATESIFASIRGYCGKWNAMSESTAKNKYTRRPLPSPSGKKYFLGAIPRTSEAFESSQWRFFGSHFSSKVRERQRLKKNLCCFALKQCWPLPGDIFFLIYNNL